MTELERKLAETLRAEAEKVRPSRHAWAVHQQRVRRRGRRRRRHNALVIGVAAVLLLVAVPFVRWAFRPDSPAVAQAATASRFDVPFLITRFQHDGMPWRLYLHVEQAGIPKRTILCFDVDPDSQPGRAIPGFPNCTAVELPQPGDLARPPYRFSYFSKRIYLYSPAVVRLKITTASGADVPTTEVARAADYAFATVPLNDQDPPRRYETFTLRGQPLTSGSLP